MQPLGSIRYAVKLAGDRLGNVRFEFFGEHLSECITYILNYTNCPAAAVTQHISISQNQLKNSHYIIIYVIKIRHFICKLNTV